MKIKPYVDRLSISKEYKDFQKKYDDAFMIAGFFILDLEGGKNMHQIDYYLPTEKKIAAFTLDGGVTVQILNAMTNAIPEKLDMQTNIDLEALPGILEDEMKNRNITEGIKKIIAILQTIEGKKIWNLNCVLSGMEILKAHIEDESKTVLKMEKSSIMDYIKKIPVGKFKQLQQAAPGSEPTGQEEPGEAGAGESAEAGIPKESRAVLEEKMKKLKQLEEAIEKERESTEKDLEDEQKKKIGAKKKKEN